MVIPTYDDAGFYGICIYVCIIIIFPCFSGVGCVFNPANVIRSYVWYAHNPILFLIYSNAYTQSIRNCSPLRTRPKRICITTLSSQIHPFGQFYRKNTAFLYVYMVAFSIPHTIKYTYMFVRFFPFSGKILNKLYCVQ